MPEYLKGIRGAFAGPLFQERYRVLVHNNPLIHTSDGGWTYLSLLLVQAQIPPLGEGGTRGPPLLLGPHATYGKVQLICRPRVVDLTGVQFVQLWTRST